MYVVTMCVYYRSSRSKNFQKGKFQVYASRVVVGYFSSEGYSIEIYSRGGGGGGGG